jgi:hypothetical protein
MRHHYLIATILFFSSPLLSSAQPTHEPLAYEPLSSGMRVQDKNFYLLTLFQKIPTLRTLLEKDAAIQSVGTHWKESMMQKVNICSKDRACLVDAFSLSSEHIQQVSERLRALATEKPVVTLVQDHLRLSGYFQALAANTDANLLVSAWQQTAKGINNILNVYGQGKKGVYPRIDSVTYAINSAYYQDAVYLWAREISRTANEHTLFFEASLEFALALLDINNRDEAARYEPLEQSENKAALLRVRKTNWKEYPYATIVVLGAVSELYNSKLPPLGKLNVRLGAENFRKGFAPFIIVTGGHVHPFRTPVCEAIEMKRELIEKYGVPEDRIIVEPHARHTTTNVRNATRLMVQYGIPPDKPSLITTNETHSAYTESKNFADRCIKELGYLPGIIQKRLSPSTVEFLPQRISLSRDPMDPLDP